MREIIHISFLGPKQPSHCTRVMQALSAYRLDILDFEQKISYGQLSLSTVIAFDHADSKAQLMKELPILAQDLKLTVQLTPILTTESISKNMNNPQQYYIVTAIANQLSAAEIAKLTQMLEQLGAQIEQITTLSETDTKNPLIPKDLRRHSLQVKISATQLTFDVLRHACLALADQLSIDIAAQTDEIYATEQRLICFDMDSTLIGQEVIDELAKEAGIGAQVAEITERAMQGELDFQQSFRARVALLKGLDAAVLPKIAARLTINEGAAHLIATLKARGFRTAIFSGGFQYFAEYVQAQLGIDEVHANHLDIVDGVLTGEVQHSIVDATRKAELLQHLADKMQISLAQTIAVGDGANDLAMLSHAGLGVAFRAKPKVRQSAAQAISHMGLDAILYLLGIHDQDRTAA
ncbi:phosphoserine phosphatase SerB [Acinetobacter larvae]|uniref:Phosphoserine phosphatase n=1 Tax=Acinetobacter larvae TaxID=1789224 RepID=A0A1B2M3C0_9GAMM|nr:phosphoserine phosphatase SerB [Acinetobacter larvae]AOA59682.1 phosphoserine phosphatase SerB [Acinetobacter larvae]